jgi:hypothetical protein
MGFAPPHHRNLVIATASKFSMEGLHHADPAGDGDEQGAANHIWRARLFRVWKDSNHPTLTATYPLSIAVKISSA